MDDVTLAMLRDVGFSLYEARLYLALLRGGAQNGNEAAKQAKIPNSKVYAALEKLAGEGWIDSVKSEAGTRYAAIAPADLVSRLRRRYNGPLDYLAEALPKTVAAKRPDPFLSLSSTNAVLAATTAIIGASLEEIHISCWSSELPSLLPALKDAAQRQVQVFGMLYGDDDLPPGAWLRHHYREIVSDRVGGRLLALVVDNREGLIARIPADSAASGVRSQDPVFALVVREYLHHDNLLQRAQGMIGFEKWDLWWQSDPSVRAEILGRAITDSTPKKINRASPRRR